MLHPKLVKAMPKFAKESGLNEQQVQAVARKARYGFDHCTIKDIVKMMFVKAEGLGFLKVYDVKLPKRPTGPLFKVGQRVSWMGEMGTVIEVQPFDPAEGVFSGILKDEVERNAIWLKARQTVKVKLDNGGTSSGLNVMFNRKFNVKRVSRCGR